MKRVLPWRAIWASAAAAVAAALLIPFYQANRLAGPIRTRLEQSLGRKVEIGGVHIRILGGPGFSVDKVVIHEDPTLGSEPLAYVETLEASASWLALLGGRLDLSELRLVNASINLQTRTSAWKFPKFLSRVSLSGARVNFKTGDLKSVVYLSNANLEIYRRSEKELGVRFSAEPARSDRPAHGFGSLRGEGRLRTGAEPILNLGLNLDRSAISDILVLTQGHDPGLGGFVTARARLSGALSKLAIQGDLQLQDLARWSWLVPGGQSGGLGFRGLLDLPGVSLDLEVPRTESLPVSVRFRANGDRGVTRWGVSAVLDHLPIASALRLARQTELPVPAIRAVEGSVVGAIGYDPTGGLQGSLKLVGIGGSLPDNSSLRIAEAGVVLSRDRIELEPARVTLRERDTVVVEARYEAGGNALDCKIQSRGIPAAVFRGAWNAVLDDPLPDLLESVRGGDWRGSLRFTRSRGAAGNWQGAVELTGASLALPGFAVPPEISARILLNGRRLEMQGFTAGVSGVKLIGNYWFNPDARTPHRLDITIPEAGWAEMEAILEPALRRQRGFLTRTLRRGSVTIPAWLAARRVAGVLRIEEFSLGDLVLADLRTRYAWNGPECIFDEIEVSAWEGSLGGRLELDTARPEPLYRGQFRFRDIPWQGGRLDAEARLQTSGTGESLVAGLTGDGRFEGRALSIPPDSELRRVAGVFRLRPGMAGPRLELREMEAILGSDTLLGRGDSALDGSVQAELAGGGRQLRLAGKLSPFQLEIVPAR